MLSYLSHFLSLASELVYGCMGEGGGGELTDTCEFVCGFFGVFFLGGGGGGKQFPLYLCEKFCKSSVRVSLLH